MELTSTFGGPECRLGSLAGEAGNDNRFFAGPADSFCSGVPFSKPNGPCIRDLAFADLVGAMKLGTPRELAKLSSSLTDDPAMLCLLFFSNCTLNTLFPSESGLNTLPFGLAGFNFLDTIEDADFDGGVEGERWLGRRFGFWVEVGEGLSELS